MARHVSALLTIGALLGAGCGGGSATAPGTTSGTIAIGSDTATGPPVRETLPFPASNGADVLALAGLRPPGKTVYDVTIGATDTTPEATYTVEITSDDTRSRLHQSQTEGDVWVGFDIASRSIAFLCTAESGGQPTCGAGDPDGSAGRTASAIARLLGNEVVESTFAGIPGSSGSGVGPDQQAGVDVSCLAGTGPVGDVRLCVSKSGFITELSAGSTHVLATSVTKDVAAADLDPPVSVSAS